MRQIKNRNNNGRPKKALVEVRDYFVKVRLNTTEYYTSVAKASKAGMTMSQYIRATLNSSVVKQRLTKEHNKIILQLIAGLNNLNQLTKRAHQGGYLSVDKEVKPLLKDMETIIKQIEYDG